eukprot:3735741-Pyramimonas_sp.AAC.1
MAVFCFLISSEGIVELSCDEASTPAHSTGCLTFGTFRRACQLSAHMCVSNSIPPLRVEYVATLKPPHLVVVCEAIQANGTLGAITVADDWWCCRRPGTRLSLQCGVTNLALNRWDR